MGWLRDLMAGATPPVRSYGLLANAALRHPDWPADTKPQPRSLAALLSKLDRRQELEWLLDRPGAQQALAEVLSTSRSVLVSTLDASLAIRDEQASRLPLPGMPFARTLELTKAPLPPGVPAVLTRPSAHQRVFWQGAAGSAPTLVGRWLSARGLAHYVAAPSLRAAFEQLEGDGPAFVEVSRAHPDLDALELDWPRCTCIAAADAPDSELLRRTHFSMLRGARVGTYLKELVEWAEDHVVTDPNFSASSCLAWLQQLERDAWLPDLETALGWIAAGDELEWESIKNESVASLTLRFLSKRVTEHVGDADGNWLHKNAEDLVAGLIRRSLTDSENRWDAPRTFDEWMSLVPEEYQRSVDAQWVQLAVARSASPLTVRELEAALARLPPGSFRVVKLLENCKLLLPGPTDATLVLQPRWLGNALARGVRTELVHASAFEWGEALLRGHEAATLAHQLQERVAQEGAEPLIEEILEMEDVTNPAYVAALELAFRATGRAVLGGAEVLAETLENLWDATLELSLEIDGVPQPRIDYPRAQRVGQPLLQRGGYYAAALALSEQLDEGSGRRHRLLRPWRHTTVPSEFALVLDEVAQTYDADPVLPEIWLLAGRLGSALGPLEAPDRHVLELPSRLLEAVAANSVTWAAVAPMLESSWEQMPAFASRVQLEWAKVAASVWDAWAAESSGPPLLDLSDGAARALWPHAPASVLQRGLKQGRLRVLDVPFEYLGEAQQLALAGLVDSAAELPDSYWRSVSRGVLEVALHRGEPSPTALRLLWDRFPDALFNKLEERVAQSPDHAVAMLDTVPDTLAASVIERLEELFTVVSDPTSERVVSRWLHRRIARRAEGWERGYPLFARLNA